MTPTQNTGLKRKMKMNKKIIVEAVKNAIFINDECTKKGKKLSTNELFFWFYRKI